MALCKMGPLSLLVESGAERRLVPVAGVGGVGAQGGADRQTWRQARTQAWLQTDLCSLLAALGVQAVEWRQAVAEERQRAAEETERQQREVAAAHEAAAARRRPADLSSSTVGKKPAIGRWKQLGWEPMWDGNHEAWYFWNTGKQVSRWQLPMRNPSEFEVTYMARNGLVLPKGME